VKDFNRVSRGKQHTNRYNCISNNSLEDSTTHLTPSFIWALTAMDSQDFKTASTRVPRQNGVWWSVCTRTEAQIGSTWTCL